MEKYKINFLKISSIMQLYLGLKLMMFVQIPKFSDYMLKKNTERIGEIYFNFKTFVWLINLQTPVQIWGTDWHNSKSPSSQDFQDTFHSMEPSDKVKCRDFGGERKFHILYSKMG